MINAFSLLSVVLIASALKAMESFSVISILKDGQVVLHDSGDVEGF